MAHRELDRSEEKNESSELGLSPQAIRRKGRIGKKADTTKKLSKKFFLKEKKKNLALPSLKEIKEFSRQQAATNVFSQASQTPAPTKGSVEEIQLPQSYDATRLGLLVRDPHWIYAIWTISPADGDKIEEGHRTKDQHLILRVYDVTLVDFNGSNANHSFDIEVGQADNWYINLWTSHVMICAELGLKSSRGEFVPLTRSNFVQTPPHGASWRTDLIWMQVDPQQRKDERIYIEGYKYDPRFDADGNFSSAKMGPSFKKRKYSLTRSEIRLYYERLLPRLREAILARLRGILKRGRMALTGETLSDQKRIRRLIPRLRQWRTGASESFLDFESLEEMRLGKKFFLPGASEQLGASASLQIQPPKREFFFEIWADLIVYGRTQPDAHVSLHGQPVSLRPDGTFTLRYTLPDGQFPFDFKAVAADQKESRSINTQVQRSTNVMPPVMLKGKVE